MTQTGMDKQIVLIALSLAAHLRKLNSAWGWSGGEMGLGKLPVPGRSTNLD